MLYTMKRTLLLFGILFTLLLALALYYQQKAKRRPIDESAFSFISSNTPLVLQFTMDDRLGALLENNDNPKLLLHTSYYKELQLMNQLVIANSAIKDIVNNNNLLIAYHPQGVEEIYATYLLDVSNRPLENLANFIPSNDTLAKAPAPSYFINTNIYHARIIADSVLHYAKVGSFLILSFQEQEVQQAIRAHLGIANLQQKPAFVNLLKRYQNKLSGVATVYVNYQNLPNYFHTFFNEKYFSAFATLKELGNYAVYALDFSKEDMLLKGKINYDAKDFISVFEGQQTSSSYLISFVPNNTMGFQDFILSDYALFRNKLKRYYTANKLNLFSVAMAVQSKRLKTNLEALIKNCAGVEYLAICSGIDTQKTAIDMVIMHLTQVEDFQKKILRINTLAKRAKTESYKGRVIACFPIRNFMQMTMGVPFDGFEAKYYCVLGDRLILAASMKQMKWYIDAYNNGNLISSSNRFKSFNANLNAQYNYLYYLPMVGNEQKCAAMLNEISLKKYFDKNAWSAYDGLAYQFSFEQQSVNTRFYMTKKLEVPNSLKYLWKFRGKIIAKSDPVILPATEPLVVFQDDSNNLNLVGLNGRLLKTIPIKEALIGSINVIKHAGSYHVLFNTANYIYLINNAGQAVPGFPIKLNCATNQTLSLINYGDKNDYRVFVNCQDHSIWGYDLLANKLLGWEGRRLEAIQSPIQQIRIQDKDYFFLHSSKGQFYWISRKGEILQSIKDSTSEAFNNPFYFVTDTALNKNKFVSTDQNGNLISVYFDGTIQKSGNKTFNKSHTFLQSDIFGDPQLEQIYIDQNKLQVYSQNNLLYQYQFTASISQPAFPLQIDSNTSGLGVISQTTNQFYMFDRRGKLMLDFPIPGKGRPSVYQTSNKAYMVILGPDGGIFAYQTQF